MNIDIPTAEEARKMVIDAADRNQMQYIAAEIKKAISYGKTSLTVDSIRPKVRVCLETKDYKTRYTENQFGYYCFISWDRDD